MDARLGSAGFTVEGLAAHLGWMIVLVADAWPASHRICRPSPPRNTTGGRPGRMPTSTPTSTWPSATAGSKRRHVDHRLRTKIVLTFEPETPTPLRNANVG